MLILLPTCCLYCHASFCFGCASATRAFFFFFFLRLDEEKIRGRFLEPFVCIFNLGLEYCFYFKELKIFCVFFFFNPQETKSDSDPTWKIDTLDCIYYFPPTKQRCFVCFVSVFRLVLVFVGTFSQVTELKDALGTLNLPVDGLKSVLQARLLEAHGHEQWSYLPLVVVGCYCRRCWRLK